MRRREPAPDLAELEYSRMTQETEVIDGTPKPLAALIEQNNKDLPIINDDQQDIIDPDNPDGELLVQPAPEVGEASEGLEITIEGFEAEKTPEEEEANAKPWVNELRKKHRDAQKRIRELEAQVNQGQKQEEAIVVGDEPTLENPTGKPEDAYDEVIYKRELKAWYERKSKFDAQQAEKRKAQEAEQTAWQERVNRYQAEKQALPVADYEEAESIVDSVMSQTQAAIIIKMAPNPAEVVYALSKNDKALQHLAAKKDPTEFIWELRGLVDKMKKTEPSKKSIPAPERIVSGGGAKSPAATSSNLEKLREEGLRTGDMTKYYEAKRRAG